MEAIKEFLRSMGEMIQEDYLEPDAIGDAVNAGLTTGSLKEEINEYMRKNPKATWEQANVVVAYQEGLICQKGYDNAVRDLKRRNKWEK